MRLKRLCYSEKKLTIKTTKTGKISGVLLTWRYYMLLPLNVLSLGNNIIEVCRHLKHLKNQDNDCN